jgi:hypothetical protein
MKKPRLSYIGIGVAVSVALGVALKNIGAGIAIGVAIGIAMSQVGGGKDE